MTVKIELTQALQIEALRSNGLTNDEILYKLKRGQIEAFSKKVPNLTFEALLDAYEADAKAFERVLREGYEAKTMTTEAAKALLGYLFAAKEGEHFAIEADKVSFIRLSDKQRAQFNAILPENWKVEHLQAN